MKQILILITLLISIAGNSQDGWHRHTFTKVYYSNDGRIGFSYPQVPSNSEHSYYLMVNYKEKQVLTYETSGKISITDTSKAIQSLLNLAGTLYDQNEKLKAQDKALYSMMILIKDGQVIDKEKWNKLLNEYLKTIKQ
jgi:uncharacterized protein YxeA